MFKRLEAWKLFQQFLDIRSGIILSVVVLNTLALGWACFIKKQNFPDGYSLFVGTVFTGVTVGKITRTITRNKDEV